MRFSISLGALVTLLALGSSGALGSQASDDAHCRPYYGSACSDAVGLWLPQFAQVGAGPAAAPTTVVDRIVDPASRGDAGFLGRQGPVDGTFFVYGNAGPPKGNVVYDRVHRIVFYDEGCCAWHHVALVSGVSAPPKTIATRPLAGIRSTRGIRLGDPSAKVLAIFGAATPRSVPGVANEKTLTFERDIINSKPSTPCEETMTFLFARDRLTAMDYGVAC